MIRRLLGAALLVAALAAAAPLGPQSAAPGGPATFSPQQRDEIIAILRHALRTDPTLLRDAIAALQQEDGRRQEAQARAALAEFEVALTRTPGDPVAGNPNGDVTVVEFFDVRCPYCKRMVPVVAELLKRDPNVRIVYKDLPVLGPASVLAARALLAAHKQGGYLRLHDDLLRGPGTIDADVLRTASRRVGLDWERLQKDMDDPDVQARINANLALSKKLEVQGTPAYVIGRQLLPGAVDLTELNDAEAAARRTR